MAVISGGGGSRPPVRGFLAELGTNPATVASGGTVPFDVVTGDNLFDSNSFLNAGTHKATIPAGLGGLYLVTFIVQTAAAAAATALTLELNCSGIFDNLYLPGSKYAPVNNAWQAGGSSL